MHKKWLNSIVFVKFKHTSPFILHLFEFLNNAQKSSPENPKNQKDTILKYCQQIYIFSFNNINLLLIEKVKGAQFLMNLAMKNREDREFLIEMLQTVSSCLRLSKVVLPFLQDKKAYFKFIFDLLKNRVDDKEITIICLQLIRLMLLDEKCIKTVSGQFSSLTIFLF